MSSRLFLTPPPKQTRSPQTERSFASLGPIASYTLFCTFFLYSFSFLSLSFSFLLHFILHPSYLLFNFPLFFACFFFFASLYTSVLCKKKNIVPPVHFARFGTSSVAAKYTKSLAYSSLHAARCQP